MNIPMLEKLLKTKISDRDEKWIDTFVKVIAETNVSLLSPDPQQGPDGFPYMMVSTEEEIEPLEDIVTWCAEKGIGIAINPQNETADFVFTYGMCWNYVTRGEFITDAPMGNDEKDIHLSAEQELFTGKPTESYWPKVTRQNFKEFLVQQGILQAKVILLSENKDGPMDLAFSLESLSNPPEAEWDGILEAFSWFFPRHYSLALLSEKSIGTAEFEPI